MYIGKYHHNVFNYVEVFSGLCPPEAEAFLQFIYTYLHFGVIGERQAHTWHMQT
jgi:hypothetical protein